MKRLFILRHAQTEPAGHGGDRERELTAQGIEDARALGRTMKAKGFIPDLVFCSPARRTKQTLGKISETLGVLQTEFQRIIYEGGYNELVELVKEADNSSNALLVVGHNPAIHQFAASMAQEDKNPLLSRLNVSYAPGTLTVLDVPRESWAELSHGENKLVDLIEP
jgi:phosphohistidine phosphatase